MLIMSNTIKMLYQTLTKYEKRQLLKKREAGSDRLFWRLALESFKIGRILVGNTEKGFGE